MFSNKRIEGFNSDQFCLQKNIGYPEDSKAIIFDKKELLVHTKDIKYLFGQLHDVHNAAKFINPSSITSNYSGNIWTQNKRYHT